MKPTFFNLSLFALIVCIAASCAKKSTDNGETTENDTIVTTTVYNLVILDRSGSMTPLREVALDGYNRTLQVIRDAQEKYSLEQQNLVSLVMFNHEVTSRYDCDTITNLPDLVLQDYLPDGSTALYDAIGISLTKLKLQLDSLDNAVAVVTIISDGCENSSRTYSLDDCVNLIELLKEMGCTIAFNGADSYGSTYNGKSFAEYMAHELHIDHYNAFEYSVEGMEDAWRKNLDASSSYYGRMHETNEDTKNMSKEERQQYRRDLDKQGYYQ